jgi:PAS domain S-box-containing protein
LGSADKTTVHFVPSGSPVLLGWAGPLTAAGVVIADRPESATVVLVDFRSMEGPTALDALRATHAGASLPVVALVNGEDAATLEAVSRAGVADFVSAPASAAELIHRIRAAEARQHERDLSMLLQLTADYAAALDVEALLHDVTRKLAEEMNVDRAALVVLDEQRDAGFIIAASDDAALKHLRIELSLYPEIREVVRTGKPVTVADAASHPLLEDVKAQVTARGIRALAALPLTVQGKVLGVLLVRASAPRSAFTSREVDFLATVAHATAVALRNARLLASERGQTEREKSARIAAEERAADLARYESYFAHVSEGIAILDQKACVLSLNPAGAQMLDVSPSEARGRHVNALTNPTDDGALHELLLAVEAGEGGRSLDLAARTLAGRRITLSISAAPLKDTSGSSILSFRDVTAQRRLADELRQTKEFQERLIDSSVDAIIASDLKGRVILYNKGAEAVCGYTAPEALTSLNVRDLYPAGVARDIMRRLREGRGRLTVTRQEIVTRSGERVPVNMTASIIYEGDRELATVGIFTDLRDRMELEQQLSAAKDRLDEAEKNAVIVALAGTAAHELNQPLTSVMGYAELLRRKLKEDDFAYRPIDTIYREAERMAEIVRKIGKITRYETKVYVGSAQILDLDKASSHED